MLPQGSLGFQPVPHLMSNRTVEVKSDLFASTSMLINVLEAPQVPFLMCTLEIPQKNLQYKFLALNILLLALLLSFSLNYVLIIYFCFSAPFKLYGSYNHINSNILELF